MKPVIEPLSYCDLIDRVVEKDLLFVFIKEPDHLSTLKRNSFLAGDVRLHEASLKKTLELLRELPKCEVSL